MPDTPVIQQQINKLDERSADVSKQIAGVGDQMQASATARSAATEPLLQGVAQAQGDAAQFIERRQAGRPVIPDFKPQPPVDAKEFQGLSYALIGMAMIGGAVSKGNWLGVADTLNGAMKGFIDGHHELAKKNVQDYEQQFKSAAAKEQQWSRETEDILKSKNLSINQKLTQVRIVAAQYDKQDMLAQGRLKSLEGVQRALDSQKTTLTGLQQRHEDNMARINAQMESRRMHEETVRALRGGGGDTAGLENDIALARTGMPSNQVVRGIGAQATQRWNQVKTGAIQQIMAENPGMKISDAAIVFATEQQEFKATGGALNQITKDIAAIRPYKEMLDKNADIAIGLADKGILTSSKVANKSLNWLRQNAADYPDSSEYLAQMRIVTTEAARVLNNPRLVGQLTDSARHEMEAIISGDMPIKSTKRVLERIKTDGTNRVAAMEREQRSLLKRSDVPNAATAPAATAAPAAPANAPAGDDKRRQDMLNRASPEQKKELEKAWGKTSSAADVIDFSELAA